MPPLVNDVIFPLGGQSKRMSFQNQEPFTFPDALNVRPEDVFERRMRGGSRPCLAKAFVAGSQVTASAQLGSGNPIRLLDAVRTGQEVQPPPSFDDNFPGSALDPAWSVWSPVYDGAAPQDSRPWQLVSADAAVLPSVSGGNAYRRGLSQGDLNAGAILNAIDYNTDAAIELETRLWSSDNNPGLFGQFNNTGSVRWLIGIGLSDDTDFSDGLVIVIYDSSTLENQSAAFAMDVWNQGNPVLPGGVPWFIGNWSNLGRVFRVVYYPTGVAEIYVGSANNLAFTISNVTLSGTRVAFGSWRPTKGARDSGFSYVNFRYTNVADSAPIAEPALVASSDGDLYYEDSARRMVLVEGQSVDLASDRLLSSAERFGKLYIADHGTRLTGVAGTTSGSGTSFTFDDTNVADWTAHDIDLNGDLVELLPGGSGEYTEGIYRIQAVAEGSLTLTSPTTLPTQGGSAIQYRIVRGIKVFDYREAGTGKLVLLTRNTGTVVNPPVGCTLIAFWQDRLVLSGDEENPGDVFMSKQGDPTNWQEDATFTSPIYGDFSTQSRMDEPVRALIPFARDYLVLGGRDSIQVIRGNPVRGGTLDVISRTVGILDKHSWCITPDNFLAVMTGEGLYGIGLDASAAIPISRDFLPKDFLALDTINNDVQLEFDVERNGIVIAVTPKTGGGSGLYYWFDWTSKRFWPESYHRDHHPTAMTTYTPSESSTPRMIWGSRDGFLRAHRESESTDDGETMESHVLIGPIRLGGNGYTSGMLREIVGQLAATSASVFCSVQVGNSIEAAYTAQPVGNFPLRPGKSLSWFPRLRGNACFIRLTCDEPWALEQLSIVREQLGKQRLLA